MSTGKMITEKIITGKVGTPTKSRIAAWWMLIVGGAVAAICLVLLLGGFVGGTGREAEMGQILSAIFTLAGIAIFIFYFLPGLLVLKAGRWGWIIASAILSIAVAGGFSSLVFEYYFTPYSLIVVITVLIPLILILSDHVPHKRGGDTNEDYMS